MFGEFTIDSLFAQTLVLFLRERGKELALGPDDTLVIPVKGAPGDQLEVPTVFLVTGK